MEVQSNENAALLKLLKSKSRTRTELLKVSSARRRARQAALDGLMGVPAARLQKFTLSDPLNGSLE
jgi:hypothetical protein